MYQRIYSSIQNHIYEAVSSTLPIQRHLRILRTATVGAYSDNFVRARVLDFWLFGVDLTICTW